MPLQTLFRIISKRVANDKLALTEYSAVKSWFANANVERLIEIVIENSPGRFEHASAPQVLNVPAQTGRPRLARSLLGDGVAQAGVNTPRS